MIDPQKIFKRFASDNEAERAVAAAKLYEFFTKDGGHPDDWALYKKGTKPPRDRAVSNRAATAWEAMCKAAEADRDNEKMSRKYAEDTLAQEREKRKQDEVELAKLREQRKQDEVELAKLRGQLKEATTADPNRPKIKRASKVPMRLCTLVDVVSEKEWEHAQRKMDDWDTSVAAEHRVEQQ